MRNSADCCKWRAGGATKDIHWMTIYTKSGDGGQTSLIGGARVSKDDARVEAYGTVDELAAHLGLLGDLCGGSETGWVVDRIAAIQKDLMAVMTVLAGGRADVPGTRELERAIDGMDVRFTGFVVPGGGLASSQAHVCRTVCRRAERRAVAAGAEDEVVSYLNRLSDWCFAVSKILVSFAQNLE